MEYPVDQEKLQNSKLFQMFLKQTRIDTAFPPPTDSTPIPPPTTSLIHTPPKSTISHPQLHPTQQYQQYRPTQRNEPQTSTSNSKEGDDSSFYITKTKQLEVLTNSLNAQLQRMKSKVQRQSGLRIQLERENKELGIKLDMLESQRSKDQLSEIKKVDEIGYWKAQAETLRSEVQHYRLEYERQKQQSLEHLQKNQHLSSELQIKQQLLVDHRGKFQELMRGNAKIKQEYFKLQSQLRESQLTVHHLRQELKSRVPYDVKKQQQPKKTRRQFANERGGGSTIATHLEEKAKVVEPAHEIETTETQKLDRKNAEQLIQRMKNADPAITKQATKIAVGEKEEKSKHSVMIRREELQTELAQLKQQKARTGAIIRRKCEIERQLQALQNQ